jgi:hypothetical protein
LAMVIFLIQTSMCMCVHFLCSFPLIYLTGTPDPILSIPSAYVSGSCLADSH